MTQTRFAIGTWAALTTLLMWPALLNGGPIVFFDTIAYFNAANIALERTIGLHTDIFATVGDMSAATDAPRLSQQPSSLQPSADASTGNISFSRSIYYALFLLIVFKIGGLWAIPLVQAGIFAAALVAALGAWLPGRPAAVAAIGAITAGFTGAPFFTSYVMPDFLSGLAVLALVRLMLPPAMGWPAALTWAALLGFALMSHMSHLLVGIGLFVCALLAIRLARLPRPRIGSVLVAGTLCIAILGELVFNYTVLQVMGSPVTRPPFVTARMIADGPGMRYLDHVCPAIPDDAVRQVLLDYDTAPPFELCRYRHRLPQNSLIILWQSDPEVGVYGAATPESRQLIAEQDFEFARGVVAHAPVAQAVASLKRFAEQITGFSLNEFHYSDGMRSQIDLALAPELSHDIGSTLFFKDVFPLHVPDIVSRSLTIASAGLLVLLALSACTMGERRTRGQDEQARARVLWVLVILVLLALAGNAAVTGILSAPHHRYQARIYWLLPLVTGLVGIHWLQLLRHNRALAFETGRK